MTVSYEGEELRRRLIALLEEERSRGPEGLSLDLLRQQSEKVYSSLIRLLAHLEYEEGEAEHHWQSIREHRELLARQLGRDPGLSVAVLDYFFNINRQLRVPKVIEIDAFEATERSAITDSLTGLFNWKYFHSSLKREVKRSQRHDLTFSLIMLDLDNFKAVNDRHGHLVGDQALVAFSEVVRQNVREFDIPCRYGGEEFAVILPETDRAGAFIVAERIRSDLESTFQNWQLEKPGFRLTVSGGVAMYPADSDSAEQLVARADQALYLSKQRGKNRITRHPQEKRRSPRFDAQKVLTLRLIEGITGEVTSQTKNFSSNGALVESEEPLSVGTELELRIRARHAEEDHSVKGRVVRLQEVQQGSATRYDLGIDFLADREEELRMLDRITQEIFPAARR